jgi:hypothetical protein
VFAKSTLEEINENRMQSFPMTLFFNSLLISAFAIAAIMEDDFTNLLLTVSVKRDLRSILAT